MNSIFVISYFGEQFITKYSYFYGWSSYWYKKENQQKVYNTEKKKKKTPTKSKAKSQNGSGQLPLHCFNWYTLAVETKFILVVYYNITLIRRWHSVHCMPLENNNKVLWSSAYIIIQYICIIMIIKMFFIW